LRRFERDAHCPIVMIHDPLRPQPYDPGQEQDPDNADGSEGGERVAKLLARAGVGSRRDVERLIGEGRVAINGRVLETPAVKVEPGDIVTVDGEVVGEPEPARLFRYHKPVGLVTTHKDPMGRPTVFEALPEGLPRLISVGRLDLNSEGLLLLTNDGQLARALEMPSTQIVRRYRARAHGRATQEKLDTLLKGVTVDGVKYGPIEAKLDKAKEGPQGANLWITVTLHEGKNREVRRVLESIGLKVNRLIRLAYGPLALGTLGVGEIEEVGPRVVREQFAEHIDPDNLPTGERPQYRVKAKTSRRAPTPAGTVTPAAAVGPREPKEKPAYKAGWAKPKPKPRPHAPPKKKTAPPKEGSRAAPFKAAAKPGNAKPGPARASGSPRAGGPSPGPRGPRPGSPPRGTPGARPRGPSRPGGRGPRG
jgi:23S rRNA pseudouridine2605 synthase